MNVRTSAGMRVIKVNYSLTVWAMLGYIQLHVFVHVTRFTCIQYKFESCTLTMQTIFLVDVSAMMREFLEAVPITSVSRVFMYRNGLYRIVLFRKPSLFNWAILYYRPKPRSYVFFVCVFQHIHNLKTAMEI